MEGAAPRITPYSHRGHINPLAGVEDSAGRPEGRPLAPSALPTEQFSFPVLLPYFPPTHLLRRDRWLSGGIKG
jgi:hypothetical protein